MFESGPDGGWGPLQKCGSQKEERKLRVAEMNGSGLTPWCLVLSDGQEGMTTWRLDGWIWSSGPAQEVWAGAVSLEGHVIIQRGCVESKG